jgi:hypothetical protein
MKRRENQPQRGMKAEESVEIFGIGHMDGKPSFDLQKIPEKDRDGLLEDYESVQSKTVELIGAVSRMLDKLDVKEKRRAPLKDILEGLKQSVHRTANQLLFHGKVNASESSDAFDELNMLLSVVTKSIEHPDIEEKRVVNEKTLYDLSTDFEDVEHRDIESAHALFSHRNVAWNVVSASPYGSKSATKAGMRLDWGPLYKKDAEGVIDKTKTEWRVAFDVSGHNIDKVMNQHSFRGHHFPDVFNYKIGILVPGLANAMKEHYDQFVDGDG